MSERNNIKELRCRLVDTMSPASAKTLRSTVLEDSALIRYFANPRSELAAGCAFSKVALGELRGLDSLYILAITAENPVQLANSTGAIAAAGNTDRLWRTYNNSSADLSQIGRKTDQAVKALAESLGGQPSGSYAGESLAEEIRTEAKTSGTAKTNQIVSGLAQRFFLLNPDLEFMTSVVEGFFLTALDTGGKRPFQDRLRSELAAAFLSQTYPVFSAAESFLENHPGDFDLIFGKKASFWHEYRYELFPNLEKIGRQIIAERASAGLPQPDRALNQAVSNLFRAGNTGISTEQARLEKERKIREKAINPEKYAWFEAKANFETKWKAFVTGYEKNNGSLNSPFTHSEFIDLFTQGIDLLHEAIFAGKNDTEIRAGMEAILPKFWPHKELNYVIEDVLNEYEYDHNGNPVSIFLPGEKVLTQIIYLPKGLRPPKLGSDIVLNEAQQSARNKIVRSLAKAAHPDISCAYSDPKKAAVMVDFLKVANGYKYYLK